MTCNDRIFSTEWKNHLFGDSTTKRIPMFKIMINKNKIIFNYYSKKSKRKANIVKKELLEVIVYYSYEYYKYVCTCNSHSFGQNCNKH